MIFQGNEKIAFYHGNARKFLFPKSPVKTYSESDREMLLKCTPKYEGVLQPKFGKFRRLRISAKVNPHSYWLFRVWNTSAHRRNLYQAPIKGGFQILNMYYQLASYKNMESHKKLSSCSIRSPDNY